MKKAFWRRGKRKILNVDKLAVTIRKKLRQDLDFPIVITGTVGMGKSVLGIQLIRRIDDNFSLERNVLFAPTVEEADKFFKEREPYSAPQFDEFGEVGYKMDFASSLSKFLKKLFMKNRQSNMAPVFCIPEFLDMDKYYRSRVMLLLFVYARGRFVAFRPLRYGVFNGDNWQTRLNQAIWDKETKGQPVTDNRTFLRIVRKWTIYYGEGSFSNLYDSLLEKYKFLKREYYLSSEKNTDFESLKIKETRKTVMLKKMVSGMIELGFDKEVMAELLGLSVATVNHYSNVKLKDSEIYSLISNFRNILLSNIKKEKKSPYLQNKYNVNTTRRDKVVPLKLPENVNQEVKSNE